MSDAPVPQPDHESAGVPDRGVPGKYVVWGIFGVSLLIALGGIALHRAQPIKGYESRKLLAYNALYLGNALMAYREREGSLPELASTDAEGNDLLSWRVALLGDLSEPSLAEIVEPDLPWNEGNNRRLQTETPTFLGPGRKLRQGERTSGTRFVALVGPGTVWAEPSPDRNDRRIAVVEYPRDDIPWASPQDLPIGRLTEVYTDSARFDPILAIRADGEVVRVESTDEGLAWLASAAVDRDPPPPEDVVRVVTKPAEGQ